MQNWAPLAAVVWQSALVSAKVPWLWPYISHDGAKYAYPVYREGEPPPASGLLGLGPWSEVVFGSSGLCYLSPRIDASPGSLV